MRALALLTVVAVAAATSLSSAGCSTCAASDSSHALEIGADSELPPFMPVTYRSAATLAEDFTAPLRLPVGFVSAANCDPPIYFTQLSQLHAAVTAPRSVYVGVEGNDAASAELQVSILVSGDLVQVSLDLLPGPGFPIAELSGRGTFATSAGQAALDQFYDGQNEPRIYPHQVPFEQHVPIQVRWELEALIAGELYTAEFQQTMRLLP